MCFLIILLTHQSLVVSYVHTGTHLAPDVTANLRPSSDHFTSIAARSTRKITSAGFHEAGIRIVSWTVSGSNVHTNALRSCEHDTILLEIGHQS